MITNEVKVRRRLSSLMIPLMGFYALVPNWSLGEVVSCQSSVVSGQWSGDKSQKAEDKCRYPLSVIRCPPENSAHPSIHPFTYSPGNVPQTDPSSRITDHAFTHPPTHPPIYPSTHSPRNVLRTAYCVLRCSGNTDAHGLAQMPTDEQHYPLSIINSQLSIMNNPFRYSGYYTDAESGMSYCSARYYSSELMTWITRDSWAVSNRYGYCSNDPVMKIDSNGHYPLENAHFGRWAIASGVMTGLGLMAGIGLLLAGSMTGNDTLKTCAMAGFGLAVLGGLGLAGSAIGQGLKMKFERISVLERTVDANNQRIVILDRELAAARAVPGLLGGGLINGSSGDLPGGRTSVPPDPASSPAAAAPVSAPRPTAARPNSGCRDVVREATDDPLATVSVPVPPEEVLFQDINVRGHDALTAAIAAAVSTSVAPATMGVAAAAAPPNVPDSTTGAAALGDGVFDSETLALQSRLGIN